MDMLSALSLLGQDKVEPGLSRLKSVAEGDTFEDIKAEAYFHMACQKMSDAKSPNPTEAMKLFDKSLALYPREATCLEAAKCALKLGRPDRAKELLDKINRDFPAGDKRVLLEARNLLPEVKSTGTRH